MSFVTFSINLVSPLKIRFHSAPTPGPASSLHLRRKELVRALGLPGERRTLTQLPGPLSAGQHEERARNKRPQRRRTPLAPFASKRPKYCGTRRQKPSLLTHTNNLGRTASPRFPGAGKCVRGSPAGSAEARRAGMHFTAEGELLPVRAAALPLPVGTKARGT